jgi:hypothetical protein
MDVLGWMGSCKPCTIKLGHSPRLLLQTRPGQLFSSNQPKSIYFSVQVDMLTPFVFLQFPLSRRNFLFTQRDFENDDHGSAGLSPHPIIIRIIYLDFFHLSIAQYDTKTF